MRQIKIAKLYHDKIQDYIQLHKEIPNEILRHLEWEGIVDLQIYIYEELLVMIMEYDELVDKNELTLNQEVQRAWDVSTGACFSESWENMGIIFKMR